MGTPERIILEGRSSEHRLSDFDHLIECTSCWDRYTKTWWNDDNEYVHEDDNSAPRFVEDDK